MKPYAARFTLLVAGVLLMFAAWPVSIDAKSQRQDRIVVKKPWPVEPVKVVAVKTKNKESIEIGKTFEEDDDWLDGLTVTVVNNYHKNVTAVSVEMVFRREPGDTRPPFSYSLRFGPSPISSEYLNRDPEKVIRASKTVLLRINPERYQNLKRYLEQTGYGNSVYRVELVIREVGFEDGSMLDAGTFYLQDPASPNDPTRKIKVGASSGAQSKKIRSPPAPTTPITRAAFLKTSHNLPNPMTSDCREKEGRQNNTCLANIGCVIGRDFLEPFQMGAFDLELRVEVCQFFFQNELHECGFNFQEVERFINCQIPCGGQWSTCLMDSDCCDGLVCDGGQCRGCGTGEVPPTCDPPEYSSIEQCCCMLNGVCISTPIIIDVEGNGFALTDLAKGVNFDMNANRSPERTSWTTASSDDAWLVLDRDGNGTIDSGLELFGNYTHQPQSSAGKNGFLALAVYDDINRGGNRDGQVNRSDSIFSSLRLWQDANHNGISESSELHGLQELGLATIELNYKESKKTDRHGNRFRYRARVRDLRGADLGRWAWDVYLLAGT